MARDLGVRSPKKAEFVLPQYMSAAMVFSHFGGMKYGKWTNTAVKLLGTCMKGSFVPHKCFYEI